MIPRESSMEFLRDLSFPREPSFGRNGTFDIPDLGLGPLGRVHSLASDTDGE
jgi:hypothetical protein